MLGGCSGGSPIGVRGDQDISSDVSQDGLPLVQTLRGNLRNGLPLVQTLRGSLRNRRNARFWVKNVLQVAMIGVDAHAVPEKVLEAFEGADDGVPLPCQR